MNPIETDVWHQIESYRGFWDLPRIVIIRSPGGLRWLLDNPFDGELDDYSPYFSIVSVSPDAPIDEIWANIERYEHCETMRVEVRRVQFDSTMHSQLLIRP
ncbi:hypothetical protein [Tahibacter amnicola]|uniref:Uncharacterized protein n=1 Tax=Tahibacter amnicola TaxID=2976241 RepID=A0ABY6B7M5_9GAMM|nr:hypothetical protein [Tahibacter amnicola]UXI65894.1 hypothetical protein N4264_14120 [Tahibacter amnicola]